MTQYTYHDSIIPPLVTNGYRKVSQSSNLGISINHSRSLNSNECKVLTDNIQIAYSTPIFNYLLQKYDILPCHTFSMFESFYNVMDIINVETISTNIIESGAYQIECLFNDLKLSHNHCAHYLKLFNDNKFGAKLFRVLFILDKACDNLFCINGKYLYD